VAGRRAMQVWGSGGGMVGMAGDFRQTDDASSLERESARSAGGGIDECGTCRLEFPIETIIDEVCRPLGRVPGFQGRARRWTTSMGIAPQ
jgi:hypothetical protein